MSRRLLADIAERVLWTAAQAGLGVVTVETFDLPPAWALVVAAGLSTLKGLVASKVGRAGSAATLPASLD